MIIAYFGRLVDLLCTGCTLHGAQPPGSRVRAYHMWIATWLWCCRWFVILRLHPGILKDRSLIQRSSPFGRSRCKSAFEFLALQFIHGKPPKVWG
jgi:hypothetical protein